MEKINLSNVTTETRNERSKDIDSKSIKEIVAIITDEDFLVAAAVKKEIVSITKTIELILESIKNNGKVYYLGAGSSGRIGVLDASEMLPTYGVADLFHGIIAGGDDALRLPIEGSEDYVEDGENDVKNAGFNDNDVLIVIGASGRTPYCIGAVSFAKKIGAKSVGIAMTKNSEFKKHCDIVIEIDTGPEVVTGSTRMKAGTATKMVLNIISTTVMIKLKKVYDNLMVDLKATNVKLQNRCVKIIQEICGTISVDEAIEVLKLASMNVKVAIVMIKKNVNELKAREILDEYNNDLRRIIG